MRFGREEKVSLSEVVVPIRALLLRLSLYFLIALSIVLIVTGKVETGPVAAFRAKLVDVTVPILEALASPVDAYHSMKRSFANTVAIHEENKRLRAENARLKHVQAGAVALESENRRLRELAKFVPAPQVSYITTRIVSDTAGPYARSAIINSGKLDNVIKGHVVVNESGLVGRVTEAGARSARVLLINDFNSRVPVTIGETSEQAILAGDNTDTLSLLYLPVHTKTQVGQRVVTSGDGAFFPAGINVGVIGSVSDKGVTVVPSADFNRLDYVSVVDYNISPEK